MKTTIVAAIIALVSMMPIPVVAQQPVTVATDQLALLQNPDPELARNKRLAFDFWRLVLEAGHVDLINQFITADFIQHNPNMRSGSDYFARLIKTERPELLEPRTTLSSPLVAIVAEGDMVVMIFRVSGPDPDDPTREFATTRHDTYRVENGLLAEHWDIEVKGVSLTRQP